MGERVGTFGVPSERVAALIAAIMHGTPPPTAPVPFRGPAPRTDAPEPLADTYAPQRAPRTGGPLGGGPAPSPAGVTWRPGVVSVGDGRWGQGPGGAYPTPLRLTGNEPGVGMSVWGGGLGAVGRGPGGDIPMPIRLGTGAALIPNLSLSAPSVIHAPPVVHAPPTSFTSGACGPGG